MTIEQYPYGKLPDGRPIHRFALSSTKGTVVELITYGAILASVRTPDRDGRTEEITLGFDSLEGYLGEHPYFGATVGRVANRIAGGSFELDGERYHLFCNNGPNHLHGGKLGFDKRVWGASPFSRGSEAGVRFDYLSADGEEGYPGNLKTSVTYILTDDDTLEISYEATTDRATPINLTNHAYWNLKGTRDGTIGDHLLTLFADAYLPVDDALIPTGEVRPVDSTPFDFRHEKRIDSDLEKAGGYDHCFVLSTPSAKAPTAENGRPLRPTAQLYEPSSGRGLRMSTTQAGVQFYTGNMLSGLLGRGGSSYGPHTGLCLETEAFPDAVNQPSFPSIILRPTHKYHEVTKLKFYCN